MASIADVKRYIKNLKADNVALGQRLRAIVVKYRQAKAKIAEITKRRPSVTVRHTVMNGNEWKFLARKQIESGRMTGEQWVAVLDTLLTAKDSKELQPFIDLVETGGRAALAREIARNAVQGENIC